MQMDHGISHVMVLGRRDKVPDNCLVVVDVTSRSKVKWTTQLSPFFLGPIDMYDGMSAKNMENAWQYCKVYEDYQENGEPTDAYWQWAKDGWNNKKAQRFPVGRGRKPEYSLWKGRHLGYIEARKEIYAPLYANAVRQLEEFQRLQCLYKKAQEENKFLVLLDFDGHNSQEVLGNYNSILYNHQKILGHAFILAMLLDKQEVWENEFDETLIHHTNIQTKYK